MCVIVGGVLQSDFVLFWGTTIVHSENLLLILFFNEEVRNTTAHCILHTAQLISLLRG